MQGTRFCPLELSRYQGEHGEEMARSLIRCQRRVSGTAQLSPARS